MLNEKKSNGDEHAVMPLFSYDEGMNPNASLELMLCSCYPYVVRCAILLGIPEMLAEALAHNQTHLSAKEMANKLEGQSVRTRDLERILKFLTAKGFLDVVSAKEGNEKDDDEACYALNSISKCFVHKKYNPTYSLRSMLLYMTEKRIMASHSHLHEYILNGAINPFQRAHGKDFWSFIGNDLELNNLFNDAMAEQSNLVINNLLKEYKEGFNSLKSVMDVGGGVGIAMSAIVSAYPHITGFNFDQPHVVSTAASDIPGVEHIGGDMFQSIPTCADAILMKNILHDWDDERCLIILKNCWRALPKDGKVIIVDHVLCMENNRVAKGGEWTTLAFDIGMMALTEGGRERTKVEWEALIISHAGFSNINFIQCRGVSLCIIEAFK